MENKFIAILGSSEVTDYTLQMILINAETKRVISAEDFESTEDDIYDYVYSIEERNEEEDDTEFDNLFGHILSPDEFPYEERLKYCANFNDFMKKFLEIEFSTEIDICQFDATEIMHLIG